MIRTRNLRPTLLWKDDKWIVPPSKNRLPPLGAFEGGSVASNLEEA
jgi:hypothetical protein